MHDFTIETGDTTVTILYCKKCGKSYRLTQTIPAWTWREIAFVDTVGETVEVPRSCEEEGKESINAVSA